MKDSLGDRMKRYESAYNTKLTPRMPVAIRVDGQAFHTFTKNFTRPFSPTIMGGMKTAALYAAKNMQGFKIGYVQSDEATFVLHDYDSHETQGWFNYEVNKMVSLSAAYMTGGFNQCIESLANVHKEFFNVNKIAAFDSRCFNIPKEEVTNLLLWRAQDWCRNSLQMYARSFFSHSECHCKNAQDLHEMLHGIGKNWTTDLNSIQKNGTFIVKEEEGLVCYNSILPKYENIAEKVEPLINIE